MRVRLVGDITGTRNGRPWPPRGSVVNLPDEEAQELCESGLAEHLEDSPPVETATVSKGRTETR